jgi:predicted enzyme related to lactoylglutathione lyase
VLKRDEYPPGVPCWIDTAQPDPDAAVRFYGKLFGWEFENVMPADSPRSYLIARLDGLGVAGVRPLADEMGPGAFWSTYVCVESADEAATKATQAGGSLAAAPFDVGDAGRTAAIADPAGAVFCVWEPKSHKGAEAVNANATWNWSELNTRGPEAATSFYGRVFGWKASAVELGGHESVMWLLPGYGDFLERLDPGLRRRHEDFGTPEGFSDAIAWMSSQAADDERPPHWSVTFATDDTRAIADRAAELGGSVLVPPFDAEVVRVAVLADPQGAVFAVNRFEPEGF